MLKSLLAASLVLVPAMTSADGARDGAQPWPHGLTIFDTCPGAGTGHGCPKVNRGGPGHGHGHGPHFESGDHDGKRFVRVYPYPYRYGYGYVYGNRYSSGRATAPYDDGRSGPLEVDVTPKTVLRLGDQIDDRFARVTAYNYGLPPSGSYYRRDGHIVRVDPDTLTIVELLGAMEPIL